MSPSVPIAADTRGGGEAPGAAREEQIGSCQMPQPPPGADGQTAGGETGGQWGDNGGTMGRGGHLGVGGGTYRGLGWEGGDGGPKLGTLGGDNGGPNWPRVGIGVGTAVSLCHL